MTKIFISYRRADSQGMAGRIYDKLVAQYGEEAVFKDVDNIPFGTNFLAHIRNVLRTCSVMLVIIGPQWLDIKEGRRRRLEDPTDVVRLEVEAALQTGVPVIPVLVDGASVPPVKRLPPSLRELSMMNAPQVRHDPDFRRDMQRLIAAIDRLPERTTASAGREPIKQPEPGGTAPEPADAASGSASLYRFPPYPPPPRAAPVSSSNSSAYSPAVPRQRYYRWAQQDALRALIFIGPAVTVLSLIFSSRDLLGEGVWLAAIGLLGWLVGMEWLLDGRLSSVFDRVVGAFLVAVGILTVIANVFTVGILQQVLADLRLSGALYAGLLHLLVGGTLLEIIGIRGRTLYRYWFGAFGVVYGVAVFLSFHVISGEALWLGGIWILVALVAFVVDRPYSFDGFFRVVIGVAFLFAGLVGISMHINQLAPALQPLNGLIQATGTEAATLAGLSLALLPSVVHMWLGYASFRYGSLSDYKG